MIFWILAIITVVLVVGNVWYNISEYGEIFIGLALGFVVLIVGAMVTFGVSVGVPTAFGYNERVLDSTYDVVALGSDDAISGRSYFLGGGYIDGYNTIDHVRVLEDGSYQLRSARADQSRIFEDDNTTPEVKVYENRKNYWVWNPWVVQSSYDYEFTVPNGTIVQDYSVNVSDK